MSADDPDSSPYVGPRPFSAAERALFFGRDQEIGELVSLVISHPYVLLYAVSGAGKTSLLTAGLMPALREQGFEVLPPCGCRRRPRRHRRAQRVHVRGAVTAGDRA